MTAAERFDRIEAALERVSKYILHFRIDVIRQFEVIDRRLDVLGSTVSGFDSEMSVVTKSSFDAQSSVADLQQKRWRDQDTAAELAARVAALEEKVAKLINPAA